MKFQTQESFLLSTPEKGMKPVPVFVTPGKYLICEVESSMPERGPLPTGSRRVTLSNGITYVHNFPGPKLDNYIKDLEPDAFRVIHQAIKYQPVQFDDRVSLERNCRFVADEVHKLIQEGKVADRKFPEDALRSWLTAPMLPNCIVRAPWLTAPLAQDSQPSVPAEPPRPLKPQPQSEKPDSLPEELRNRVAYFDVPVIYQGRKWDAQISLMECRDSVTRGVVSATANSDPSVKRANAQFIWPLNRGEPARLKTISSPVSQDLQKEYMEATEFLLTALQAHAELLSQHNPTPTPIPSEFHISQMLLKGHVRRPHPVRKRDGRKGVRRSTIVNEEKMTPEELKIAVATRNYLNQLATTYIGDLAKFGAWLAERYKVPTKDMDRAFAQADHGDPIPFVLPPQGPSMD